MRCAEKDLLLYAVTDRSWLGEHTLKEQVEEAIRGGATFIQLREKELDQEHFLEEAKELKELCGRYGVPFVVNDNVRTGCMWARATWKPWTCGPFWGRRRSSAFRLRP